MVKCATRFKEFFFPSVFFALQHCENDYCTHRLSACIQNKDEKRNKMKETKTSESVKVRKNPYLPFRRVYLNKKRKRNKRK